MSVSEAACISDAGKLAFVLYLGAMFVLLAVAGICAVLNANMRANRPPGGYAPAPTKPPNIGGGGKPPRQQ